MNYIEYDENDIQSFEYETTIVSDSNIIGTCELGKAEIQMLNDSNEYSSLKESWIETVHGSFYIYDVAPVQEKVNIKLSCYDIKYKLDKPYDSSKHTFPCKLKEWRNSIFNDCEVIYDDSDFPNSELLLEEEPYVENGASNRQVIQMIAQAGASAVVTDENDCFYFKWFEDVIHTVEDWTELTTEKESSKPVNTIVLGRGSTEDNVYYPEEEPSEKVEFRIDNNYILDPQDVTSTEDRRYQTRIPIYEQVNGFSYLIFSIRTQNIENKLSVKLGQKVRYLDIYDNELEAYIMTKKVTYLGGNMLDDDNYEISLSAEKIKETSTDLSYASSIVDDIRRVERKADKNADIIEDVIEEQHGQQNQMTQMTMNINNIQNLFQITGGNNLIKNSVGLFGNEYWSQSEEGTFTFGEDSNLIGRTTSASKIAISKGILETTNINITGLTLDTVKSFNFKIRQDEDVTTTVTLYGMSESSPLYKKTFTGAKDWQDIYNEEECRFFVDNPDLTLKIESTSTYNGKVEISDLMLNDGEKQQWQPSSGEVWGTVIKMSQLGISCYSIEGGFVTMMTTTGFQVRELHGSTIGDVITDLTRFGISTTDVNLTGKYTQQNWVQDVIISNNHKVLVEYEIGVI